MACHGVINLCKVKLNMKKIQIARDALTIGNDFYHLMSAIQDHGPSAVINRLASAIYDTEEISWPDAYRKAATHVDYCQNPARIFKEVRRNLDSDEGFIPVAGC